MSKKKIGIKMQKEWTVTDSHSYSMMVCQCGDVFQASGSSETVSSLAKAWNEKHADCKEQKREGAKIFWLSFCDGDRPKGHQFLGACIVEVSAAEADEAAIDVMLRFPLAQPGAEWIAAAVRKAHRLGCNPGGEVASVELPADHPNLTCYEFGVLMDRAALEAIDEMIPL